MLIEKLNERNNFLLKGVINSLDLSKIDENNIWFTTFEDNAFNIHEFSKPENQKVFLDILREIYGKSFNVYLNNRLLTGSKRNPIDNVLDPHVRMVVEYFKGKII